MINGKKIVGLIPARMKSTRLPGKPLKDILGLPMIIHVMKRVMLCEGLDAVYVATDSEEICEVVKKYGGKAIMTSDIHKTGSDRIAEAVISIDCDIVVNIQGDEPLVDPKDITKVIFPLIADRELHFTTLLCKTSQFKDLAECKIVTDLNKNILYFSREDIPSSARVPQDSLYKLYNLIAFRKAALLKFAGWAQTPLEKVEFIEYLRILEHGYIMRGVVVDSNIRSVDTPEDLEIVRDLMQTDTIKDQYLNNGPLY